jgi:Transposase IS116/IS110/IS902 family
VGPKFVVTVGPELVDILTLARLAIVTPEILRPLELRDADGAALDRRVRAGDRLTQEASLHKVRIKDLVRQLLPMTPLTGDLGQADLAVLERYGDPRALVKPGRARLTGLIERASAGHQGVERAQEWLAAAQTALEIYGAHHAVAFSDLAAEVATEVRLLRAIQAELLAHEAAREEHYRRVDPQLLARSLPGLKRIGAPVLVATMGEANRFKSAANFRSFTGLAPRASETGNTDRKGQPMSKAGNSLLRTTLVRAADAARKQDPQLARIYYVQMTERGKTHLGALCVVAAHLAERAWLVMRRGTPYVVCDTDGIPVDPWRAKQIIAEHCTVTEETRKRRRSNQRGEGPSKSPHGTFAVTRRGRGQDEATFPNSYSSPIRRQRQAERLTGDLR